MIFVLSISFFDDYKSTLYIYPVKNKKEMHLAVTGNMLPQWGFPYEILANTALYSVKKTENPEIYARIYTQLLSPCCNQSMTESRTINYDLLKASVNEIIKKYPSTFNYNKMSQTACLLGDKSLYKALMKDMKNNKKPLVSELWFSGKDYECQSLMNEK